MDGVRGVGQWWRDGVVYQVYIRSFTDSDGDGVGDLAGIRGRLGYLELLGVDAIWLSPFYPSPGTDHGYDVTDHRDVDPLLGNLDEFDRLLTAAHRHGIKVIVDVVGNHTSDQHEWFRAALGSTPGSPERARYIFHPGRGAGGDEPPNNWRNTLGGAAWSRLSPPADGPGEPASGAAGTQPPPQWYLHLFGPGQPDLNWANPEVWADLEKTLRFWCDRGVDGVRIDVAHGMVKADGLPDDPVLPGWLRADELDPRFDQEAVHDVHRMIRSVLDDYPGRVAVGEIVVREVERFARYLRPDELQLGVDGRLREAAFDADELRAAIEATLAGATLAGAPPVWMLANHDVPRAVTRYGGGLRGLRRARAMAIVALALPGSACLYNGEELGLPDVVLPEDALRDPVWELSGRTRRGRDACRVPLPWEGDSPGYGFTEGAPWLPIPAGYGKLTVAEQLEDVTSTLSLHRAAIELRNRHPAFTGGSIEWFGAPPGCFAFRRTGSTLVCALNTAAEPVPLPPGDVILTSCTLTRDGQLPPDTAAWLA